MGRRHESRTEEGFKNVVQVSLDGILIERNFRNKGDAIAYLQRTEDLSREDINKRVKFVFNVSVTN